MYAIKYIATYEKKSGRTFFISEILLLVVFALSISLAWPTESIATPMSPELRNYEQSDGTVVKVRAWGDEFYSGFETEDGHAVLRNENTKDWHYAEHDENGDFKSTSRVVGKHDPPSGIQKHLRPTGKTYQELLNKRREHDNSLPKPINLKSPAKVINQMDSSTNISSKTSTNAGLSVSPPLTEKSLFKAAASVAAITPAITKNVLSVLATFSNSEPSSSVAAFEQLFYSQNFKKYSLRDYYKEVTNNLLDITGYSVGWVRVSQNHDDYKYREQAFAMEAINLVSRNYLLAYSNSCHIDTIIVVHQGEDWQTSQNFSDMSTSHFGPPNGITGAPYIQTHGGQTYKFDTVCKYRSDWFGNETSIPEVWFTVDNVLVVPEIQRDFNFDINNPIYNLAGVGGVAHEMGHALGLPDLYDTDYSSSGVGAWSLMAAGNKNREPGSSIRGSSPAHLDAWSKQYIGAADAIKVNGTMANIEILPVEGSNQIYTLQKDSANKPREYFIVENRQKIGFDAGLPGSGLLIWHIEDMGLPVVGFPLLTTLSNDFECITSPSGGSNCATQHYRVALVQADNQYHLEKKNGLSDNGDPYPYVIPRSGENPNYVFSQHSNPSSNYYDGTPSNVGVMDINNGYEGSMFATLTVDVKGPESGICGSSHSKSNTVAPITDLCLYGAKSQVSGSGPWSWSCSGSNGGTNASCVSYLKGQATSQIPHTGQATCYNSTGSAISCTGTGQDGEKLAGIAWPNPRFADNGDQTVTDKLTGLIWSKDGSSPGPTACDPAPTKTWQGSLDYVKCLNANSWLGKNDWRLPNIVELESLVHKEQTNPSTWLNNQGFANVNASTYLSSTSETSLTSRNLAWKVGMGLGGGYAQSGSKDDSNYVWPVRGGLGGVLILPKTGQTTCFNSTGKPIGCAQTGQDGDRQEGIAWPLPRFSPSSQTLKDSLTGLIWPKDANTPGPAICVPGVIKYWQTALDYVQCLNANAWLGYNDWRLPNANELRSLLNYGRSEVSDSGNPVRQWLTSQGFSISEPIYSAFWSSTSLYAANGNRYYGLTVGMDVGGVGDGEKYIGGMELANTWPVRGGKTGSYASLVISKNGSGSGSVTSLPTGIDCGLTCSVPFAIGDNVTLTAMPDGNRSAFIGWSGACSGMGTCQVSMTESKSVAAEFITLVNGAACGNSNLSVFAVAPTTNLCAIGTASSLNGTGPWSWTCKSAAGGIGTSCSAYMLGNHTISIPQTGQTTCYDSNGAIVSCPGTGQDGELKMGISLPNPRFADNADQTVTDKLTGLIWSKDGNAPGPTACAPATAKNWQDALNYVKCLNTNNWLGKHDWRLPNVSELESLVQKGKTNTSIWLNSQGFANVQASSYWSSTTCTYVPYLAWYVNMNEGIVRNNNNKSISINVWPVRGGDSTSNIALSIPKTGQKICYPATGVVDNTGTTIDCVGTGQDGELQMGVEWPTHRFNNNGNNTVSDNLTGLIWLEDLNTPRPLLCGLSVTKGWQASLDHFKCLNAYNWLGFSDWRLPNINELRSLVNYGQPHSFDWLNSQGFYNIPGKSASTSSNFISSSTNIADALDAWYVEGYNGYVGKATKANSTWSWIVWPVRGGQSSTSISSLTVSKSGTGTGSITSTPAGISCGSICSSPFVIGTLVVLTASPDSGSTFAGWSGACSNITGTCTVTIDSVKSVTATFTASTTTLSTGLVAWYPMDGNANDASGNGRNGTVTGAVLTTGHSNLSNAAYYFDGTVPSAGDAPNITIPDNSAFHFTNQFTLSTWVKPESISGAHRILVKTYGLDAWALKIVNGNYEFTTNFPDGSLWGTGVTISTPATANVWAHVTGVYDGNQIILYLNGTKVTSKSATGLIQDSFRPVNISGETYKGSADTLNGSIDDVRIYNRALSAAEVQSLNSLPDSRITTYSLALTKAGSGTGSVTPSAGSINWSNNSGSTGYAIGTSVILTATPVSGSTFTGWSGACSNITGPCTVSMDSAKSVTATFTALGSASACGTSNGATVSIAPTTNLCTTGTATAVTGTGPWSWSCLGTNGGNPANCTASKATAPGVIQLPQTGQTACYDTVGAVITCTGTGQDGDIRAGVAWPYPRTTEPRTIDSADPNQIFRDNLTGLIWSRDANPAGIINPPVGGNTYQTTNELDIAINGNGFFQVMLPDGSVGYSRGISSSGGFYLDGNGVITMSGGYPIIPQIVIPSNGTGIEISGDGTISVRLGQDIPTAVGIIQLATFPQPQRLALHRYLNVYVPTNASGEPTNGIPGVGGLGTITQKMVEQPGVMTWSQALDFVKQLNIDNYCGFSDWRLPNINELGSLLNSRGNFSGTGGYYYRKDTNDLLHYYSVSNPQTNYWSSTSSSGDSYAWIHNREFEDTLKYNKKDLFNVWPVRGESSGVWLLPKTGQSSCFDGNGTSIDCSGSGQDGELQKGMSWPSIRFSLNSDQASYTDNLTGLIWPKNTNLMKSRDPSSDTFSTAGDGSVSWQQSLNYIAKLNAENYLGYSDWRLPNRIELESVLNRGITDSCAWLLSSGFNNCVQGNSTNPYWSSTTGSTDAAWQVSLNKADVYKIQKNGTFSGGFVWPVRGGIVGDLIEPNQGVCGTSNNNIFTVAPSSNLCSTGTATAVTGTGTGPWSWSCTGSNGGTTATCSANIDATGPTLTPSTLATNAITNTATLNISGTVTDASGVASLTVNTAAVTITNGSFSTAVTLVAGANTITIVATDTLGNSTTDTRSITLDQTAPTLTVTTPADNSKTAQALATIGGTINETSTVTVKLNSGTAQSTTITGSDFTNTLTLASGLNSITINATDLAGNTSSAVRSVTYDDTKPSIAITTPNQDSTFNQTALTVSGTVSDAQTAATVSISFNNQTYTPTITSGTFTQTLTIPAEGTFAIIATATDEVGNNSSATRNIIYVAPTNGVCGSSAGQAHGTAPTTNLCSTGTATAVTGTGPWGWSCTGSNSGVTATCSSDIQTNTVTFIAALGGNLTGSASQSVNTGAATTAVTATPITGYHFVNWSGTGGFVTTTTNPLTVSNVTAAQTITANFTPDPINGVCGTSKDGTFQTIPVSGFCTTGTATTVTGTGPWSWTCTGSNGGTTATCSANIDATGPTLTPSTLATNAITNNATLNISGTVTDSSGVASLTVNTTAVTITNGTFSTAVTLAAGTNTITIVATDTLGNSTTDTRSITLDQTAPTLTVTTPADNNKTAQALATISGTINETSTVTVKLNSGTAQSAVISGSSYSADLTLTSGLNSITITATDLAGNTSSTVRTVTLDNTKPSVAITTPNQDSTVNQTALTVSGTISDTQTTATVSISFNNQTYTPTITAGTFTQTFTIPSEGTFAITVTATDEVGNSSSATRNIIYAAPINGICGSSSGQAQGTAPTANLCTTGTATAVTGTGPWSWSCTGSNGGTTATCQTAAPVVCTTIYLPVCGTDNKTYPNECEAGVAGVKVASQGVCTTAAIKAGDCDNNGTVTIAEVQSAINMFLGLKSVEACVNQDGVGGVSIAEVQKTINSFLGL